MLLALLNARYVGFDELPGYDFELCLTNVNTAEDYNQLQSL